MRQVLQELRDILASNVLCMIAAVVFVPAKTPVKLEATDDGIDIWVASVNTQAFEGELHAVGCSLSHTVQNHPLCTQCLTLCFAHSY